MYNNYCNIAWVYIASTDGFANKLALRGPIRCCEAA